MICIYGTISNLKSEPVRLAPPSQDNHWTAGQQSHTSEIQGKSIVMDQASDQSSKTIVLMGDYQLDMLV